MLEPHGLTIEPVFEILEKPHIPIIREANTKMEAFIRLDNQKDKALEVPARSLLNNFLAVLHSVLSANAHATYSRIRSVSAGASLSATNARVNGIQIGVGDAAVALSDTDLQTNLNPSGVPYASIIHKGTTFVAPYVQDGKIRFDIRRLFTNDLGGSDMVIFETGIRAQRLATTKSTNADLLLSRDLISYNGDPYYNFAAQEDLRVSFKFRVNYSTTGGLLMNMVRLIYNLFFKGNANATGSLLVGRTNQAQSSYTAATNVPLPASNPFCLASGIGWLSGIVVGYYGDQFSTTSPNISADETTFTVNHNNLTAAANVISAITNPTSNQAQFTVTREFTNSSLTLTKYINRVGALTLGTYDGNALTDDQAFLAIHKPQGNYVGILPGQTFRAGYKFTVQV